jgi:hypothetical protein
VSDPTPRLARTVLIFEALVVLFGALVARTLTDVGTAAALGGGGALAVALVLTTGLLRRRAGYVVVPEMLVLAVLFVGLWIAALVLGQRAASQAARPGAPGAE